jgi:predicted ATPase/DNA-binding XRE family transcriptional regulator
MPLPNETFAAQLRRLRKQRGLTQRDLAQQVGCSEDLIRKLEAGRRNPSRDLARLLTTAFTLPDDARGAFESSARAKVIATSGCKIGNLPAAVEPTFGREPECRRVCEALRTGVTRLISLTGPGGIGKTHLARDVAERATLLVLDNFEHVLAAAADIRALLDACPALVCLVTSRERLRLTSERVFVLKPLACAEPGAAPHDVAASPAGGLFVERMSRLEADFTITEPSAARIAEICRAVDGLPLAICIIAARAGMYSLDAIDSGLSAVQESIDFDDAPGRHRSLHAALLWSYRLLYADEQRCFARFSVVNGASLAMASAVCDVPLIEKTLQALIDKCLLQREQHGDVLRFRQLAPVRQFARTLLVEPGAEADALEHMDAWLTAQLKQLYARYAAGEPDMDAEWLRMDLELDNFRGAARTGAPRHRALCRVDQRKPPLDVGARPRPRRRRAGTRCARVGVVYSRGFPAARPVVGGCQRHAGHL